MPARAAATAAGAGSGSMKKSKPEPIPVMDYRQYRRARRLVHECCNYDGGHCIALDDGEECVCVQSISYSLLCRWFRAAVLPLDRELETALFHRLDAKRCAVCGALFTPGSNRAKYCPECAPKVHRRQLYRAGRWGGMCLRPVYFLLPVVQVVSGGGIAAG